MGLFLAALEIHGCGLALDGFPRCHRMGTEGKDRYTLWRFFASFLILKIESKRTRLFFSVVTPER